LTDRLPRAHPRYAIELDVVLSLDVGDVPGRTHDLSRGGFCMRTERAVPLGVRCNVRLALVFSETEFSEHLTLPGHVVWCSRIDEEYQLGIKFEATDANARGYLELFIRFLEGDPDLPDDDPDDDEPTNPGKR